MDDSTTPAGRHVADDGAELPWGARSQPRGSCTATRRPRFREAPGAGAASTWPTPIEIVASRRPVALPHRAQRGIASESSRGSPAAVAQRFPRAATAGDAAANGASRSRITRSGTSVANAPIAAGGRLHQLPVVVENVEGRTLRRAVRPSTAMGGDLASTLLSGGSSAVTAVAVSMAGDSPPMDETNRGNSARSRCSRQDLLAAAARPLISTQTLAARYDIDGSRLPTFRS